jgi:hypothetical protein
VVVWDAVRVAGDWFRSREWSPEAQADFEARLARARPYNRAQYMRIKGLALADAGEKRGARQLWERVLESTEEFATAQQASALEHLLPHCVAVGVQPGDDPAVIVADIARLEAVTSEIDHDPRPSSARRRPNGCA